MPCCSDALRHSNVADGPNTVFLQVDEEAVQEIQALLQGVRDEIESLHATYLKARCVR